MPIWGAAIPRPCRRCEPQRHVQRSIATRPPPPSILGLLRQRERSWRQGQNRVTILDDAMGSAAASHWQCRYQFSELLTAPNRYPCSGSRPRAGRGSGVIDPRHLTVAFWGSHAHAARRPARRGRPRTAPRRQLHPGRRMPAPKGYSNRCSHSGSATDTLLSSATKSPPTTVRRNSRRSGQPGIRPCVLPRAPTSPVGLDRSKGPAPMAGVSP